ncbi:hypothetical protein C8R46DRAFT_1057674 [Mycena filopes]|nr:hypothetical protein C8R46DRAFT_1057674 [Mycena filopes]
MAAQAGPPNAQFPLNETRQTPMPADSFAPKMPAHAVAACIYNEPESWTKGREGHLTVNGMHELERGRKGTKEEGKPDGEGNEAVPILTVSLDVDEVKDTVDDLHRMTIVWAHRSLFPAFSSPGLSALPPASPDRFSTTLAPTPAVLTGMPSVANSATWGILEYYGVAPPETPATTDARGFERPRVRSSSRLKLPAHPEEPPPPPPPVPGTPVTTPLRVKSKRNTMAKASSGKTALLATMPTPPTSRSPSPAPAPPAPPPVPGTPVTTPLRVKSKRNTMGKANPRKAALLMAIPTPPASRPPSPFAATVDKESSAPAAPPPPAPRARAPPAIRPLPAIPNQQQRKAVPMLASSGEWTRPRARATTTTVRRLPRTPTQAMGHSRSQTIPEATSSAIKRPRVAPPF